jgi:tetratricopeptide (TPR) repeat protein/Tol biopolymer transport system component
MSETKSALIIANYRYEHPDLRQLVAPAQDAESLARVLADRALGGFEVRTVINEPHHRVNLEIESFCENRKRDDLLLIYFSGHGIKDADGQLYFATVDTQLSQHNVRCATAVSAYFVNEMMSRSRSRRQILLLDCCYSGAFKHGMLAKGGKRVGAGEQFEGQGRVVLTASDALQYSFEGGHVEGEGVRSVFTRTLVQGLETGEADLDRDGLFSLDEVYDYLYDRVSDEQPEQKPTKMGYVEGRIFIGTNPRPLAAELPPELQLSLDHSLAGVRVGAVQELERLLAAKSKGLVLAAQAALARLASGDDSLQVRAAAAKALARRSTALVPPDEIAPGPAAAWRPQEQRLPREQQGLEAERLAARRAEQERINREKAAGERAAQETAERERLERERAEAAQRARLAQEKAAQERQTHDKAEAERLAGEKPEQKRLAREKAENRQVQENAEAKRVAREQAEHERDAWVTRVNRGNALRKKGNAKAAIAEYHEAVRLDPQNDIPRIRLADALEGIGKLDEAITECRQALRLKPDSAEAHYHLGLFLYEKHYVESSPKYVRSALAEYGEALRLNPKHTQAHHSLAEALEKKGDLAGALEHYRIASELEPKNSVFRADYQELAKAEAKRAAEEAEAERVSRERAKRERPTELLTLSRDNSAGVAWSPDGKRLATGGDYHNVKVWDAETRKELLTLSGHTHLVLGVAWSPDGKRLATASSDNTARVWDAATGQQLFTLSGHQDGVSSVAWNPSGTRLATGSKDKTAKLWDARSGEGLLRRFSRWTCVTLTGHTDAVMGAVWSPDGNRLATGSRDGTARVWDAGSGKELLTLRGHNSYVFSVAWSPDGKRLATGSCDGTAKVWDAGSGKELLTLSGHSGDVRSVAWSPDGRWLATGSNHKDKNVRVWDAQGGKELLTLSGHNRAGVFSVAWSPDGRRLATGGYDDKVRVWDAERERELLTPH